MEYRPAGEMTLEIPGEHREASTRDLIVDFYATAVRHVRLKVTGIKECPEWHDGAGNKAWIFMDEITFR